MSILKVAAINNPSAPSGGLVLDTDGNVSGAGMDLIVSQSFSAASAVNVNNCFSADYDNYKIMCRVSTSGSTVYALVRLRASGTDASATDYKHGGSVSASGYVGTDGSTADSSFPVNYHGDATETAIIFDVTSPALAQRTTVHGQAWRNDNYGRAFSGRHELSTAYDGFTLYPSSGTISGVLRLYGYRN